jgi:hypothetical protein
MRPKEKPGEYDAAAGLAKRGVVEADSCSGTGVGYCGFNYRGPAGVLHVTTVGGDPDPGEDAVVGYGVECSAK